MEIAFNAGLRPALTEAAPLGLGDSLHFLKFSVTLFLKEPDV
jgi:hypothetical protein